MYIGPHVKNPVIFFKIWSTWILSIDFKKIIKFHENLPVGTEFLHSDRQT